MKRTPVRAVTLGKPHNLLPARISNMTFLLGKASPRDTGAGEASKKLIRPQKAYFEVPVHTPAASEAQQRADDYHGLEYPMIWAAFDVPEKVPMLLRDRLVSGDREAFSARWLAAAAHWVKEARYWRAIGIERPFYEPTQLRAHTWAKAGADAGNVQRSAAMVDALRDLERAVRREAEGLPANYVWENWGPWGNVDGSRAQHLPRFRADPYEDPDGIEVNVEDVAGLTSHDKIKERFNHIIYADEAPLKGAFLSVTNGAIRFDSFGDGLKQRIAALRGMTPEECQSASGASDIRTMIYLSALPDTFKAVLEDASSWDELVAAVGAQRAECDAKVDAARLLYTLRDLDEVRLFYEEKCGFGDFHRTTDKQLTAATLTQIADLQTIAAQEWGPALLRCTIDVERSDAMGETAFAVFRELVDIDRDVRRRQWNSRFTEQANEEKTLDYMLQNFSRRTERFSSVNEPGEDFDREREPIGRNTQRRVLESDIASAKTFAGAEPKSRLERFMQRVRERRHKDATTDVKYNQLVRDARFK